MLNDSNNEKKKELTTLFSNTVMLYIMQISAYIFPLMTFPYLTRVLGPEKYGLMNVANAVIVYFQMLVDFGFLLSATRSCSIHRNDLGKLSKIVSSIMQAKLLLAGLGFVVLLFVAFGMEQFADKRDYLLYCYLSVFLSVFIPDYLFRGMEKMHNITYRSIISRSIYTVLVFLVIKREADYWMIPLLNAVSNLFIVVWSWAFATKHFGVKYQLVGWGETLRALKESAIFFISRIATTAYSASNVFVLGMVVGTNSPAMGQFTAANNLITQGRGMFGPIADSLYPYMVMKKNYKLIKIIMVLTAPLILIGVGILFVYADVFIRIFCGPGYEGAVPIFRAMLPMLAITLPIYILGFPTLGAMNMLKEANYTVMYAAAFHVVGLCVLYLTGHLTFIPVSLLTCCSEVVVLTTRTMYVIKGRRRLRREAMKKDEE